MKFFPYFILLSSLYLFSCNETEDAEPSIPETPPAIPSLSYTVVSSFPHDTNAFTEGLLLHNNKFYESTGATEQLPQTRSLFGELDTTSGKIKVKVELDREKYFGEGIVFLNDKVYQLTYTTKVGFIYDAKSFKKLGEFTLPSAEGWGMTTDGTHIILSDGTHTLYFLDPNTMQVVKKLNVTENGYGKDNLNELEYIQGSIYANIFTTNTIVKINPNTGEIIGTMDLSVLYQQAKQEYYLSLEMNGIAFDSTTKRVYVTGKLWPKVYALELTNL